ncbi:MAG: hypothetical protein B6I28_06395 [Fusobacteriia bacterium 4572_132]|nr:MAG: hypothetical protein B6I28_06395 [Fusobacteriia bacterium 4572_132]
MNRLPNRIKEKVDNEKIWKDELKEKIKELYYESEKYDSILHSKLEILINQVDDLISLKNTEMDYIDPIALKIKTDKKNKIFYDEFEDKKKIVKNLIVEIVTVISMKSYNVTHIKEAPEEFKKQVADIIMPLDSFFEIISYMKKEYVEDEIPEGLEKDDISDVKRQFENEFKINKRE